MPKSLLIPREGYQISFIASPISLPYPISLENKTSIYIKIVKSKWDKQQERALRCRFGFSWNVWEHPHALTTKQLQYSPRLIDIRTVTGVSDPLHLQNDHPF